VSVIHHCRQSPAAVRDLFVSRNRIRTIFSYYPVFLLFVINVIIFIIRVLKLLFMHGNYFFIACVVITVLASPAAGSLTKISAGAPVYLGEQNLDISAGLQGCRVIDWWEAGADTSAPHQKNVTIIRTLEDSNIAFRYTIDPDIYAGYEGMWYCEGVRPLRPVFEVFRPELSVRFWDLDSDADVSGTTIPVTANITYRIDTNLDKALQSRYRPEMTSLDSFYTVSLSDPGNNVLSLIYTGSYGRPGSQGLVFEKNPVISVSPYFWKDGSAWDRTSKNIQGDLIYPLGTYTLSVNQDLSHMQEMYADSRPEERQGMLDASADVTFFKPATTPVPATSPPAPGTLTPTVTSLPGSPAPSPSATVVPARTTTLVKTTYSPLPPWVSLAALGLALAYMIRLKR
jgi:hypothetical protein